MTIGMRKCAIAPVMACALGSITMFAGAESPARITVKVNGGEAVTIVQPGEKLVNALVYDGTYATPVDSTIDWNLTAELDPSQQALVTGTIAFDNPTPKVVAYEVTLEFPLCPEIAQNSALGAYTSITMNTDADGGEIALDEEDGAVWSLVCDGNTAAEIFHVPFTLNASGAGVASTNAALGEPFPALAGPAVRRDFGWKLAFTLSPNDTATFTNMLIMSADPDDLAPCVSADIDGDGLVSVADLLILLGQWGACDGCPGDLDGSGVVDVNDMLMMIADWG